MTIVTLIVTNFFAICQSLISVFRVSVRVNGENGPAAAHQSRSESRPAARSSRHSPSEGSRRRTGPLPQGAGPLASGHAGERNDVKLILDTATANQTAGKPSLGVFSVPLGTFLYVSACRAIPGIRLLSLPPADRWRSNARTLRAAAPASGPGGVLDKQISRFDEATREWFIWRFGDDA